MPKAKKLPSGNYRTQVYAGTNENGKKIYESFTAPTAKESELMAAKFKASRSHSDGKTVGEAVTGYIKAKEPVLSPKTIKEYKAMQKNHLDPIKDKPIRKLTSEDLQLFVSSLVGEVSPKTIANIYGLVSSSLSFYAPDTVYRVTLPKRAKKKQIAPSDDDIKALYNNADTETKLYIALAAFGSCRRGEICAIKYADLLPDGVYIHADIVQNDKNEWVYKEMPKTSESVRKVKLPDSVLALFGNGEADEFVIKRTPLAVSHKYERLRHNLGLDHIRFHDLRHYFASIAAVLDIPQNYIADFGGWRKDSPVLREVYQNKIIPIAEQYSEKLNSHFRKLID